MDILALIERSDYFQGVSVKNRELLAGICIPKELKKKEVLFNEGDKGFAFYLLASGAVSLYKGAENGREVVIKIVRPGEPFAEVILFEQDKYPVSAIALKPGLVFSIPKKQFYSLLDIENFRNDFLSMLMRKQRYLAERIRFLTMYDVEERFFIFLKEHFGQKDRIILNLSKKDIASAIGATPETYSRLLARLIEDKKIKIDGKIIYFLDHIIDS
jgi:CRP/FNR family transcriptional regulator, dissimilatory nitrate respiration regulator